MNELELLLQCCRKSLENSKGGVKTKSGQKMSYKSALKTIDRLDMFFRSKGAFSIGICKDCIHFNQSGHQSVADHGGSCDARRTHTTVYDTCDRHEAIE